MTGFQGIVWTERLSASQALMTTLVGLVVVFAVLAILIGFIELMHVLLKEKPKAQNKQESDDGKRISAGVIAETPETDFASDGEFVAAVSTAISVYTGKPNGSFRIKSIKKG